MTMCTSLVGSTNLTWSSRVCLPAWTARVLPAVVAQNMRRTFPQIRIGLLVGIGGGIPDLAKGVDIRLGDVVVSQPAGEYGGVI